MKNKILMFSNWALRQTLLFVSQHGGFSGEVIRFPPHWKYPYLKTSFHRHRATNA